MSNCLQHIGTSRLLASCFWCETQAPLAQAFLSDLWMEPRWHATMLLCCSVPRNMARYNDARTRALLLPFAVLVKYRWYHSCSSYYFKHMSFIALLFHPIIV